jgi:hypothetical protein
MLDDAVYIYEKVRKNFGRPMPNLAEDSKAIGGFQHDEGRRNSNYNTKNPKNITLGNIPEFSEHAVLQALA